MSISSSDSAEALPVTGRSIRGHLDLRGEVREDGTPYLSRQSFRAPIHLSKAHVESRMLLVHLVNPTAGFFDGDRLDLSVTAGKDCPMVLSTPGASRVYRARSPEPAVMNQRITVESGGFIEWIPEPFIPQAGARYAQTTTVELAADAGLMFFEWIAPGRVARGEIFVYRSLRWEFDLTVAGNLVARERFTLDPADDSLTALRSHFPAAHYLTAYAAGIPAAVWPAEEIEALQEEGLYLGHGPLLQGVFIVRALAADSMVARRFLAALREILHRAGGRTAARLGRLIA